MGKGSGKGAGKGGDNWNAGGVGVAIDLEAFKAEVDALGAKLKAEQVWRASTPRATIASSTPPLPLPPPLAQPAGRWHSVVLLRQLPRLSSAVLMWTFVRVRVTLTAPISRRFGDGRSSSGYLASSRWVRPWACPAPW